MNSHADSVVKRDATLLGAGLLALIALALAVGTFVSVDLAAQAPAAGPAFEVASVKANRSGDGRVMLGLQPGGRFSAQNVPLRLLIQNAYRVQGFQIVGAPDWISSERYDISAKAEGNPAQDQIQQMMRALLADRFHLEVHRDTREMPIYALVLARADGTLGPKLKPSAVDCAAAGRGGPGRGAAPPSPQAPGGLQCGMRMGPGALTAGGMAVSNLATSLSNSVNRVVVDRTGLTGNFDFELSWTPELPGGAPGGAFGPPGGGAARDIDPNGPSLFTALQEQLGLKLDSTRGPVETLVIDRVERPTEN